MQEIIALSDKSITLERNEYLKVKGSVDTNVYYIVNGTVRAFILDDGEEQILRFGYRDNLITALDSYLTEKPSEIYIQAIKKTEVKVISKKQILEFLKADVQNQIMWTKILEQLVVQQMEREIDILTASPIERYNRVLKRSPQLFQEIPAKYIANYLRMTPETLSRIRNS